MAVVTIRAGWRWQCACGWRSQVVHAEHLTPAETESFQHLALHHHKVDDGEWRVVHTATLQPAIAC